ncbi:MAG TPA: T9SS type A sorting domain-containing protein, partial [Cytophagaceae bacterium]
VYTVPYVDGVTYTWTYTNGSGVTINGTGNSVTLDFSSTATSGTLTVVADDGSGPSLPRSINITVLPTITGLEDVSMLSVNVYPNPFAEISNLNFDLPTASEVSIEVYNMLGIKTKTLLENEKLSAGNHNYEISDLANGTYLVRLVIGGQSKEMVIIKQQ